jgi:hypothetical protein
MDFGEILTRSWNIIWKHKILWLFGFLAALGRGSGPNVNYQFDMPFGNRQDFNLPRMNELPRWLQGFVESMPIWLPVLLVLLVMVLVVLTIVLSTFGRIGLSRGAWLADEGEERLGLGQLWSYGRRYFGRVVVMILIIAAVSFVLALIIGIPAILLTVVTMGIGLICLLPLLCVLGIALSLFWVVFDLAIVGIVNEDLSTMDSLRRGWEIFKNNLAQIIGMAVILWILSAVIGFIIGLPVLLIAAPIILGAISQTRAALGGGALISIILFLLYLPILMVVQGILQSYTGSAWTLVFRRLTGRPALNQ